MMDKEKVKFIAKLKKARPDVVTELPQKGIADEIILRRMKKEGEESAKLVRQGKMSGAVYISEQKHWDVIAESMRLNCFANPIHLDDFRFACQCESEVIRMGISLYKGDKECAGLITSGGTESIFTATLSYRDYGQKTKGITRGNVVACETAHCAIDKSCHYLGLELRKVKRDANGNFDLRACEAAIDSNTLFIYASSPEYAFGNYDDVVSLGQIALKYDIGLHNDCCLGSFVNPFIESSGYQPATKFDFTVPGVTTISCDTHKYGFSPKAPPSSCSRLAPEEIPAFTPGSSGQEAFTSPLP